MARDQSATLLKEFMKKHHIGKFRPCALYHKTLDTLYVYLKDKSYTSSASESAFVDIFVENHPQNTVTPEIVGYALNNVGTYLGINHRQENYPIEGRRFTEVVDEMREVIPLKIFSELRRIARENNLTVIRD